MARLHDKLPHQEVTTLLQRLEAITAIDRQLEIGAREVKNVFTRINQEAGNRIIRECAGDYLAHRRMLDYITEQREIASVTDGRGFDVYIFVSTSRTEAEYWQERFEATKGQILPKDSIVLSVYSEGPDRWHGLTDNGSASLYAFLLANRLLMERYREEVEAKYGKAMNLWEILADERPIMMMLMAGKGQRMQPLAANNKSAIPLPAVVRLPDGNIVPTNVGEAVAYSSGILAGTREGRLTEIWGDQINIPGEEIASSKTHAIEIFNTVCPFMTVEEKAYAAQKGNLLSTGEEADVVQREKPPLEEIEKHARYLAGIYVADLSLGFNSYRWEFLLALIEMFRNELKDKRGCFNMDSGLWTPLTFESGDAYAEFMWDKKIADLRKSLKEGLIDKERFDKDASEKEGEASKNKNIEWWMRISKMLDNFVKGYGQQYRVWNGRYGVLGRVDYGLQDKTTDWWDFGQLANYYNSLMQMLFESREIDQRRQTWAAERIRRFFGIRNKDEWVTHSETGTCDIRDSIVLGCDIKRGKVKNCILINVTAEELNLENAIVFGTTVYRLNATEGNNIVQDVISSTPITLEQGDVLASHYIPGRGQQTFKVNYLLTDPNDPNYYGYKELYDSRVVFGNPMTFAELSDTLKEFTRTEQDAERAKVLAQAGFAAKTTPATSMEGTTPGTQATGRVLAADEATQFDNALRVLFNTGQFRIVKRDDIRPGFQFAVMDNLIEVLDAVGLPINVPPGRGGEEFEHGLLQAPLDSYVYEYFEKNNPQALVTLANHEWAHLMIWNFEEMSEAKREEARKTNPEGYGIWRKWVIAGKPMGQAQERFVNGLSKKYNTVDISRKIEQLAREKRRRNMRQAEARLPEGKAREKAVEVALDTIAAIGEREASHQLAFGTSGLRDTVGNMTDQECYINTLGFIGYLEEIGDIDRKDPSRNVISLAGDRRSSTPRIMKAVARAIADAGYRVDYCGLLPTPAITYWAMQNNRPCVMVTGSHIPDDRNGIKFTKCAGEVLKSDEKGILASVAKVRKREYARRRTDFLFDVNGRFKVQEAKKNKDELRLLEEVNEEAEEAYVQRYLSVFPPDSLKGKRIVLYQHSSVGRDILQRIFEGLGAEVITIKRSARFMPVDTEKVSQATHGVLQAAAEKHEPFAVISADGDTDRPLLADENGRFLPGDKLGVLACLYLDPTFVAIPDTANDAVVSGLEGKGITVVPTKVGSPYVIAAMNAELAANPGAKTVSWEVNGGFLTGSDWEVNGHTLKALPTRDAVLPLICSLLLAKEQGKAVSEMIDDENNLPHRYTHADAINDTTPGCEVFTPAMGKSIIKSFSPADENVEEIRFADDGSVSRRNAGEREFQSASDALAGQMRDVRERLGRYFSGERGFGDVVGVRVLDGVRIFFSNGDIVHLRPSGNEPILRMYACADTQGRANDIVAMRLEIYPEIIGDFEATAPVTGPARAGRKTPGIYSAAGDVTSALASGTPGRLKPSKTRKPWGRHDPEEGAKVGELEFTGKDSKVGIPGQTETVNLYAAIEANPQAMLGQAVVNAYGTKPILLKRLTPGETYGTCDLSRQVHDTKNKLWIVTGTRGHNPRIILGFNRARYDEFLKKSNGNTEEAKKAFFAAYEAVLEEYSGLLTAISEVIGKNKSKHPVFMQGLNASGNLLQYILSEPDIIMDGAVAECRADIDRLLEVEKVLNSFYNFVSVKRGDVIVIPKGTPHALLHGVEVIEPQIEGRTLPLEDGARYPVRYPIEVENGKVVSIAGVPAEVIFNALNLEYEEPQFRVISEGEGVRVEELGVFPGLAVHRITLAPNTVYKDTTRDGYHILEVSQGEATVRTSQGDASLKTSEDGGVPLFNSASVGDYEATAGERGATVVKSFAPIEREEGGERVGDMTETTLTAPLADHGLNRRELNLKADGSTSETVSLAEPSAVSLTGVKGRGFVTVTLTAGNSAEVIDGRMGTFSLSTAEPQVTINNPGTISVRSDEAAILEVTYPETALEKAAFTTFEAFRHAVTEGIVGGRALELLIDPDLYDVLYKKGDPNVQNGRRNEEDEIESFVRRFGPGVEVRFTRVRDWGKYTPAKIAGSKYIPVALITDRERTQAEMEILAGMRVAPPVPATAIVGLAPGEGYSAQRILEMLSVVLGSVTPEFLRDDSEVAVRLLCAINSMTRNPLSSTAELSRFLPLEETRLSDPAAAASRYQNIVRARLDLLPIAPYDPTSDVQSKLMALWSV